MDRFGETNRDIPAARRGQIIQRILVDGWSPAQAAASLGVGERQVLRWVAAYRRDGMASLHGDVLSERAPRRWVRRIRMILIGLGRRLGQSEPARCVVLRRRGED